MLRASLSSSWLTRIALGATVASAALVAEPPDARACGGCFHEPAPSQTVTSVITDHRMALSISTTQTVLWDQVQYSGSAGAFAWVLPVKPGARIELSQDAWLASLDASTQTVIQGPPANCGGPPQDQYVGGGGGCGASSSSAEAFSPGVSGAAADVDAGAVQVVSQQVVGPYDAVTVRSSQGEALGEWLRANGYEIPQDIQPTIDAFTNEGFDFIALKLAPGEGVQAMQPVRVVQPGANLSLPLRMVAAGVGANVGLELFVLSEGRYDTQNFPAATIDFSMLAWDPTNDVSNYTTLASAALAQNGGRGWLTEMAGPAILGAYSANGVNPPLDVAYQSTCTSQTLVPLCDAGAPAPVSGEAGTDAGADAGAEVDASANADTGAALADSGACQPTVIPCDDLTVAMTGISSGALYVTRLRSLLPSSALAADLELEASASQAPVPSFHAASRYTVAGYNPCPSSAASSPPSSACATSPERPGTRYTDAIVALLVATGIAFGARRRRA